jgi:UDP-N-acetylmuramoyl-tripeptide--D-alanyl-D-alanine ligase
MRTLAQFATDSGGKLVGDDTQYSGVSTDTRTLQRGELFVALRGPRFNANDFVKAAHAAGAAGAVCDARQEVPIAQIVVGDTQKALVAAAHRWRQRFSIPVIGVAGSNGKTTVKEMTAAILGAAGPCLATRGNLNNHIGVPLTLFRLDATHRYAVIEMGANRAGDVAELVEIARPTVGLITNAGAEHLEGFGSLEGVARAEGEMVAGLQADAVAVINADDPYAALWRGMTSATVRTFGVEQAADFSAEGLSTEIDDGGFATRFVMRTPMGSAPVTLRLGGRHNVLNALCAAAAATAAGASLEHVSAGLATMRAVPGRLQFKKSASGATVIDDSYNANPSSMRAAIDVLATMSGRKWLVVGDMAELGDFADASHREIGAFARSRGIDRLFAIGAMTPLAVESFGAGAEWFADGDALASALRLAVPKEASVTLLVKGSRVNKLERVVEAIAGAGAERRAS